MNMKIQTWTRTALAGAAILAIATGAASAQSEMTDKIRLESAAPAAQIDFAVTGGLLNISKVNGGTKTVIQDSSAAQGARELLQLTNNGSSFFIFEDTDPAGPTVRNRWSFNNNNGNFLITNQNPAGLKLRFLGSNVVRFDAGAQTNFIMDANGNATFHGTVVGGSDVNSKENLVPVSPDQILDKVSELPILEWSYIGTPGVRHVGPTAQAFRAAFGLGATDKGIAMVDMDGVALASIQALNERLGSQAQSMSKLEQENAALRNELAELRQMIESSRKAD